MGKRDQTTSTRRRRMPSQDSFGAKSTLDVDGKAYEIYRLDAVTGDGLDAAGLPFSLKVLLENLLRTEDGADITADHIRALAGWDADAEPDKEIQFTPARVIRSEEHTSELQSPCNLVCRLLLETKNKPTDHESRTDVP